MANEHPTILFDGVCNLCNIWVGMVIRRDPAARFRFAPLQSEAARNLLADVAAPLPDSIVLVEPGKGDGGGARVSTRSTAALRISRGLRFPWPLLYGLIVVPRPLRDWAYGLIARNRYRLFGKRETCMVPTPELRSRFLG